MSRALTSDAARQRAGRTPPSVLPDYALIAVVSVVLALGLIMVASASLHLAEQQWGQPFYYLARQLLFAGLGILMGWLAWKTPLHVWERIGGVLFLGGLLLLLAVLIPGVGREVNGSTRWLPLGPFNLQVSELVKVFTVIFLAGYLVRRGNEVRRSWWGLLKPMAVLAVAGALLVAEPDFGAATVIMATALGMLFIGGARLLQLGSLLSLGLVAGAALIVASPYRLQRILTFLDPWEDPYDSGFQLTQALIAFGRGEWFGVGLGSGVQKLFYLPEAHTDFLLAVIAEETGFVGVVALVGMFGFIVWRALSLGTRAHLLEKPFAGFLASGIGLWLGIQAFVSMGVNMGLLPTKGLTLPLMSYGGSSMLTACLAIGLLLRIHREIALAAADNALERDRCARV